MSMFPTTEQKVESIITDLEFAYNIIHIATRHGLSFDDCPTLPCPDNRRNLNTHKKTLNETWWN